MFDSLEEKIKQDDELEIPRSERIVKAAVITVLSILVFGGLFLAVRMVGS